MGRGSSDSVYFHAWGPFVVNGMCCTWAAYGGEGVPNSHAICGTLLVKFRHYEVSPHLELPQVLNTASVGVHNFRGFAHIWADVITKSEMTAYWFGGMW